MRALIVYSDTPKLAAMAKSVAEGLRGIGMDVRLLEAKGGSDTIVAAPYDLICIGSPVKGFFGGQIAGDVDASIKRFSRLEGKQAAVFVTGGVFGVGKSLRRLMSLLERQGAWVQDFASLKSASEAQAFGRRLQTAIR